MNRNIIWGTKCECGTDCFILQKECHPWGAGEISIRVICPSCEKVHEIDREKAAEFYNDLIYSFFDDIKGTVLDFGCGGGFLTNHALTQLPAENIYALDIKPECRNEIRKISEEINFICGSILEMQKQLSNQPIDEFISRDVMMFIEQPEEFIRAVTDVITKRVRIMAWYKPETGRMKNNLTPEDLKALFEKYGWQVKLKHLDWYAWGYYLDAER